MLTTQRKNHRRRRRRTMHCPRGFLLLASSLIPASTSAWPLSLSSHTTSNSLQRTNNGRTPFSDTVRVTSARIKTSRPMLEVSYPSIDEMVAGGERYEMVPLPDTMLDTTCWVGSLCEFVTDDDLSNLFSEISSLQSLPACVARNPNASSRKYGFVTFPNVREKENAIIRLNGCKLNGKRIKVEPITDKPGQNRVRVPGKIIAYVLGYIPKEDEQVRTAGTTSSNRPNKKKKNSQRNDSRRLTVETLPEPDQGAFRRASRQGFLTLEGTGYRRGRKGSPLATLHRQWCDFRDKPQIVLCKASGGRPLDNVIVDLSPLRFGAQLPNSQVADNKLLKYRSDILKAAEDAGMMFRPDYVEDNSEKILVEIDEVSKKFEVLVGIPTIDSSSWVTKPISKLPSVSMGIFEGERSNAKAMVKALSSKWKVADPDDEYDNIDVVVSIPTNSGNGSISNADGGSSSGSTGGNRPRRGNKDYKNGGTRRRRARMKSNVKGLRQHRNAKKGRREQDFSSCW